MSVKGLTGISQEEQEWRIKSAASTLVEAKRIESDPELHAAAVNELRSQTDDARKVIGRARSSEKKSESDGATQQNGSFVFQSTPIEGAAYPGRV